MKQKIYEPKFGEMSFRMAINRDIVADVFDKFNDYYADYIGLVEIVNRKNAENVEETNGLAFAEQVLRSGKSRMLIDNDDIVEEIARYALPKMIEAVGDISHNEAKTKANEIFAYAAENDAIMLLSTKIGDIIMEGFTTTRAEEKPKITLTME